MLLRIALLAVAFVGTYAADPIALSRVGDSWRYQLAGSDASIPPETWRQPGYDDSAWLSGPSSFSFGLSPSEATNLSTTLTNGIAVLFRRTFDLEAPGAVQWLTLRIEYCDGFVAYLNGQEIARRNVPGEVGMPVPFAAQAMAPQSRGLPEEINVTFARDLLRPGPNVLAVQVHLQAVGRGLSFSAELLSNFTRAPYLQNMTSNSVRIVWKTPVPGSSLVRYGRESQLDQSSSSPELVTTHAVTLTNLEPGAMYSYRVASVKDVESVASPLHQFRTFRTSGPLRFAVFGDGGWNSVDQYQIASVIQRMAPDFVLEAGDIVYPSFTAALADPHCFSVYSPHMATTPYFFALGNHDLYSGTGPYLDAFYLPTNSVPEPYHLASGTSPEHYYSFDHGDAHVTVLFVPFLGQYRLSVGDPQYHWLTNDLASSAQPWKVVVWHVPMSTSSGHRGDDSNLNGVLDRLEVRDVLLPVLSRYGVQLALCGHEHGYERFNPTNGVHAITTAGGGGEMYSFTESDASSAVFWPRFNAVQVTITGDELEAEALGTDGNVFDRMTIRRAPPTPTLHRASWQAPAPEIASRSGAPGSVSKVRPPGESLGALAGQFSNLGLLRVSNDSTKLYVGLEQVMIHSDNDIYLFIESPRLSGVSSMSGLGNGVFDPAGQGVDGLDFLENLQFVNFQPAVACLLGDVHAPGQFRSFARTNLALNLGQGVFRLDTNLSDVAGIRLVQSTGFEGLPRVETRDNAQLIRVEIPLAELGGLRSGEVVRVGAAVGGSAFDLNAQTRLLDSGYVGDSFRIEASGQAFLQGAAFQLAFDPDADEDGDGLSRSQEVALGTDPAQPDSDGDGLPDGWEVMQHLSPLSGSAQDGAEGDPDQDGVLNRAEFIAGTDPQDPTSRLRLSFTVTLAGKLQVTWQGAAQRDYFLQGSIQADGEFVDVVGANFRVGSDAKQLSYETNLDSEDPPWRFYRVRVVPGAAP